MPKYKDYKKHVNEKQKSDMLQKLLVVILLLSISFGLINIVRIFGDEFTEVFSQDDTEISLFPLVIKNEQLIQPFEVGGNLGVLTRRTINIYTQYGAFESKTVHGYNNPVIKSNSNNVLIYDRGNTIFRVDSATKNIGEVTVGGNIITANISHYNYVAVVVTDDRYTSVVEVYDQNLKLVFKYSVNQKILSVDFSDDKYMINCLSLNVEDGYFATVLHEVDILSNDSISKTVYNDIIGLSVHSNNTGNNVIVSTNEVLATSSEDIYFFSSNLVKYEVYEGNTLLCFDNAEGTASTLIVLSDKNEIVSSYELVDKVIDMQMTPYGLVVLTKNDVIKSNIKFDNISIYDIDKSYDSIVACGNNIYVMSSTELDLVDTRN